MSLINDALRKAQKQRTGELPVLGSMPTIGGESAGRIAKRARPAGFYTLLIRLGAGAALLVGVIIGGVVLLRKKSPGPAAQQPAIIAQSPAPKPADPAPATVTPATATPAAPTFVVPVAATPAPVRTETPQPAPATVAAVPPKTEPAKPAAPPAKLEPRAINFIESLRVAGIRASATDSKVLMNDRVYRIGNVIEHEMGIRLTGITANSLTFEDERGGSYTRTF